MLADLFYISTTSCKVWLQVKVRVEQVERAETHALFTWAIGKEPMFLAIRLNILQRSLPSYVIC